MTMLGTQVSGILSTVGSSVGPPGGGIGQGEEPAGNPGDGTGNGQGAGGSNDGAGDVPLLDVNRPDLLIIKTGAIAIQVGAIDAAVSGSNQVIAGLGGYTSGSERSGDEEGEQASVTYRVPAQRWDEAVGAVANIGIKVLHEQTSTEDVTGQVVDLGARIRNLQATESALQAIMAKATEIKDVLSVQAELTQVRGEIETATAEKAHLEGQAAFSTLTVTFSLKPDPVLAEQQGFDPATEVDQASASLVGILQDLASAGIWFGIVWVPILVGLGVVVALAAWVLRRVSRRLDRPASAIASRGAE
jgi:hypothetical protein